MGILAHIREHDAVLDAAKRYVIAAMRGEVAPLVIVADDEFDPEHRMGITLSDRGDGRIVITAWYDDYPYPDKVAEFFVSPAKFEEFAASVVD